MLTSFQDAFWTELGRTWAPKRPKMTPSWRPKTTPKRRKIEDDFQERKQHSSRPSWSRLVPILGHLDRAWGHLGAILGGLGEQKPLIFLRIFTIFEKSRFCIKMVILAGLEAILGRLGAILGPLGPNLGRFGRPRGPKREAKRDPRGTKHETTMTSIF